MSAYANDRRVKQHPDGSWMVFDHDDDWTEYNVFRGGDGLWHGADSHGRLIPKASGMATMDQAIHALIGDPR